MKALKFSLFLFCTCFLVVNLNAQDDKDYTSQKRSVGSFDGISVGGGIDLFIKQGGSQSVEVKANSEVIDKIITEVKGGTLDIRFENKNGWKGWKDNGKLKVYVTTNDLKRIHAAGGSDVVSEGKLRFDDFEITASGGSDINLEIESKKMVCEVSGGSDTDLVGSADELKISASGGSDFNGYKFKVKDCYVKASGGSDSHVYANGVLEVNASGASDVHYKGSPTSTKLKSTGSSDIHSANEN